MSRNMRLYYYAVLGAMGGLVGGRLFDAIGYGGRAVYISDVILGAALGLSIGFMIGMAEAVLSRSLLSGLRAGAVGGVVGLVLGALALPLSEFLFQAIGAGLFGRALGWAFFGALIGIADSISARLQMWKGMVGGFIGGFVGGALLEFVFNQFDSPLLGKFAGLMLLGAAIGVFTALIVVALSRAWLEVVSGKLKGTEFILDKFVGEGAPAAILGSNVLKSDIALPDPLIAPQHARLKGTGAAMTLQDMSTEGTYVNGRKVELHRLSDKETIRMGKTELVYHEKRT
jgi:hypothetical protein